MLLSLGLLNFSENHPRKKENMLKSSWSTRTSVEDVFLFKTSKDLSVMNGDQV